MIKWLRVKGNWRSIADACNTTINKNEGTKAPSATWKLRLILSEHSPIRKLIIEWKWQDLLSWVSVHFVRHNVGITHFVRTQRTDRTGVKRDLLPQGNLVEHECEANAQAIINISRKRLCRKASPETRGAWIHFLIQLEKKEPELVIACVPDCIYRGHCFEFESCGKYKSDTYKKELTQYREGAANK